MQAPQVPVAVDTSPTIVESTPIVIQTAQVPTLVHAAQAAIVVEPEVPAMVESIRTETIGLIETPEIPSIIEIKPETATSSEAESQSTSFLLPQDQPVCDMIDESFQNEKLVFDEQPNLDLLADDSLNPLNDSAMQSISDVTDASTTELGSDMITD